MIGSLVAIAVIKALYPGITPAEIAGITVPRGLDQGASHQLTRITKGSRPG
jgi:hypothetical protein